MAVPLRALTVRTSLFTCKCSQVYIFQIIETFVYKPIVCKLTYVCALASAHTSNLFVYMHISTNIHVLCEGHFCTRTHGAETHICLCPCERSQLKPLYVHANTHKYTIFKSHTFVYKPNVCNLTYVCAHASAHSQNLFVYMQILTSIQVSNHRYFCIQTQCVQPHMCLCPCKCTHFEPLCKHAYIHTYIV